MGQPITNPISGPSFDFTFTIGPELDNTLEAAGKFRTSSLCQSWESEVLIWIFPDTVFTRLYAHLVWRVRSVTELRSRDCNAGSCDAQLTIYFQSENPSIELFMTPTLIILQLT